MIATCQECGRRLYVGIPHPVCVCGHAYERTDVSHTEQPEPAWVRLVAYFRLPEDAGIGDTVARYAAMLGGEQFKALSKKIGLPCGCTERQAEWNAKYPYTAPHDPPGSSSR